MIEEPVVELIVPPRPSFLRHAFHAVFVFSVALVSLSVLSAGVFSYVHKDTFYPGVSVQGIPMAGLTLAEGTLKVKDRLTTVLGRSVIVAVPDTSKDRDPVTHRYPDVEVATTASALGLHASGSDAVANAWALGHTGNFVSWLRTVVFAMSHPHNEVISYTFNDTEISTFVNTKVDAVAAPPTPAQLKIVNGTANVVEGKAGIAINRQVLEDQLHAQLAASDDLDPIYIHAPATERFSAVSESTVQPLADRLNEITNLHLTLASTGVSKTPTHDELSAWFLATQDDIGQVSLSVASDQVANYLQKNAKNVDQTKSLDAVVQKLTSLTKDDVATVAPNGSLSIALVAQPVKAITAGNYTLGDFPGRYIEVSIADQKMYRIDGSTLEKIYSVSSGTWTNPTPTGTFTIASKSPRAYSPKFGLYMPQWMNLRNDDHNNGEYGIHSLPVWPSGVVEDPNHIGQRRSHGCVRLGIADAIEMYGWADIRTPVIIR